MNVWIVEDNELLRESLSVVIDQTDGLTCPLHVGSCEEALGAFRYEPPPDLVLLDIGLPGMDGIEGLRRIHGISPTTQILMLTVHEDDDEVFEAICAGASGYLLKPTSPARVVESIRELQEGGSPMNAQIARKVLDMFQRIAVPRQSYDLTDREREVLELLVKGLTRKRIADRLFLSEHTIKTHIRNVYAKLHVQTRSGAVAKALKERII